MSSRQYEYRRRRVGSGGLGVAFLSVVFGAVNPAPAYAAEIYRWSDQSGITHFGDTPPPSGRYEALNLDDSGSAAAASVSSEAAALQARTDKAAREQACVEALRQMLRMERNAHPLPSSGSAEQALGSVPFTLEPLLTEREKHRTTVADRWAFPDAPVTPVLDEYRHGIAENCAPGVAAQERQLAALNAEIQQSNCRVLRAHQDNYKIAGTHSGQQLSTYRELLKNACG